MSKSALQKIYESSFGKSETKVTIEEEPLIEEPIKSLNDPKLYNGLNILKQTDDTLQPQPSSEAAKGGFMPPTNLPLLSHLIHPKPNRIFGLPCMDSIEIPKRKYIKEFLPWQSKLEDMIESRLRPMGHIIFIHVSLSGKGVSSYIKHKCIEDSSNIFLGPASLGSVTHTMRNILKNNIKPKNVFVDLTFTRCGDPIVTESLKILQDGLYPSTPHYAETKVWEVNNIIIFCPYILDIKTQLSRFQPNFEYYLLTCNDLMEKELIDVFHYLYNPANHNYDPNEPDPYEQLELIPEEVIINGISYN